MNAVVLDTVDKGCEMNGRADAAASGCTPPRLSTRPLDRALLDWLDLLVLVPGGLGVLVGARHLGVAIGLGLFACFFLAQVVTDDATGRRAGHAMVPGHVPGNAADQRPLQAAGVRRAGGGGEGDQQGHRDQFEFHGIHFPYRGASRFRPPVLHRRAGCGRLVYGAARTGANRVRHARPSNSSGPSDCVVQPRILAIICGFAKAETCRRDG
jgi:hypothetical protein